MNKLSKIATCLAFALCFNAFTSVVQAEPLVQEGKKTVFQRVVSHPSAILFSDSEMTKQKGTPRTFTSFYVFDRKPGKLQVGVSTEKPDGWIKSSSVTEWPQAITMVFTDQMGRDPVLFFKDHQAIKNACEAENIGNYLKEYVRLFGEKARIPDDSPVIAAEPMGEEGQVSKNRFYLLPVLNIDTQYKESGTNLLEVASIDPGNLEASSGKSASEKAGSGQADGNNDGKSPNAAPRMKTGLAFVIDTTISMRPYIEQTTKLIHEIYDSLQESPAKDDVEIAIVAFRNNMDKAPGIEYTTKVISDFKNVKERKELESLLREVKEAKVPTHAFDEDSFAGVKEAVDRLNWSKFNSRAILLVTDAGPLKEGDPTSSTGFSAEGLADYLRAQGIYLTVAHVKSPNGSKDHNYAEKQYRELSKMSNNRSSYVDIKALTAKQGSETFKKVGQILGTTYRKVVEATNAGEKVQKPKTEEIPQKASPEEKMKRLAEATGYAMQLQFAGSVNKTEAPTVVKAWISDSDLANLEKNPQDAPVPAVYPAVLMTKSQLSQLRKQIKLIITTAEEAFLRDSENFNFYEQLISAAAQMSRDPSKFNADPNANLAQKGVLLEVLDGLPYRSRILGLKKEDWVNMSTGEQQEFISRLKALFARYDEYDRDERNWESFGSTNPNEWVYRVPLNMLP